MAGFSLPGPLISVRRDRFGMRGVCGSVRGYGDTTAQEYLHGGERVHAFLREQGSDVRQWRVPGQTRELPEAEWGFDTGLANDLETFARENGYRVARLSFADPQDVSPFATDYFREWHHRQGVSASRLVVECFSEMEPAWTLRSRTVPFWLTFNTAVSHRALVRYLDSGVTSTICISCSRRMGLKALGMYRFRSGATCSPAPAVTAALSAIHLRSIPTTSHRI